MERSHFFDSLNIKRHCNEYRVGLWECPQFLFIVMGAIIIVAILTTHVVAQRYAEPEISALIVLGVTALLFTIGHFVVASFERIAYSARSKSEFISIMSHHLRSPLSAVKWQIDALRTKEAHVSPDTTRDLESIDIQNERMIRAVNDLLEVNRIEDNDLVLRPKSLSLLDLTQQAVERYRHYASANNVRMTVDAPPNLPMVVADEERIRRVIDHLLDNAIRYSVHGGEVRIEITPHEKVLRWSVRDRGAGIPEKDQSRVFEKFFRSQSVVRHQTQGAGIGLFIARALIKKSGGAMGFFSVPNQGSLFWFILPQAV